MPFPILFGTTVTTVLHYRADCDSTITSNGTYLIVPVKVKSENLYRALSSNDRTTSNALDVLVSMQ